MLLIPGPNEYPVGRQESGTFRELRRKASISAATVSPRHTTAIAIVSKRCCLRVRRILVSIASPSVELQAESASPGGEVAENDIFEAGFLGRTGAVGRIGRRAVDWLALGQPPQRQPLRALPGERANGRRSGRR